MKKCIDYDIKELLPVFLEQKLEQPEQIRVQKHLESCADCREELSLLRVMAEETVPDPGEAYWATMPDRVFRAVEAQKMKKRTLDLSWLADRLTLPRWVLGAATVGILVTVSLLVIQSPRKGPAVSPAPSAQGFEFVDEAIVADDVHISALDHNQLDTVSAWAGNELASIADEVEHARVTASDADLDEELSELNAREAERLSTILDQWKEEG